MGGIVIGKSCIARESVGTGLAFQSSIPMLQIVHKDLAQAIE
jgi:hypothetical protein